MQVKFDNVTADYRLGPICSPNILQSVNLNIVAGTFTAIIGNTGAGKSSLLKTINGLLTPKTGKVIIGDHTIDHRKNKNDLKEVRKHVGMVFQFPESQLFAETVEKDICFGPINFGVKEREAKEIARKVIRQVGLDDDILLKSPFSLSGGQKRRVAIAGMLAMKPSVLVLDEPGAGLDPKGKKEILSLIKSWHDEQGMTILLVTHDMNDVAKYADDLIVMEKGKVLIHDKVRSVFSNKQFVQKWKLEVPDALRFQYNIEDQSGLTLRQTCLTIEELADALIEVALA